MDMIKKIALTASTMLFVLAQAFSFYVILVSQQEKINLIKEKENRIFERSIANVSRDLNKISYKNSLQDYVITYCFRSHMPEGSALYKGEEEIYNNSSFTFDAAKVDMQLSKGIFPCIQETINDRHLLVFYREDQMRRSEKYRPEYLFFYVIDVTYIYKKSWELVIREMIISTLASLVMALLLVYLIKKITRPLQAVNESQRQLIGSMSHELKTPLTAMKGYSETLLQVKLSQEQQEKALDYIHRESGRLSRLSEKMMELTKLYEPECKISLQSISVEVLFETVAESVQHKLEEKELILLWEGEYRDKKMEIDQDLMTSFLINLINNSVMASKPGNHIYLGADHNSLWVRDQGCGIPSQEVDKVRRAFYRVDKSRSRKSGNMGLGLALCEQIAAVHHGVMQIESEVGEGTKVSLVFDEKNRLPILYN